MRILAPTDQKMNKRGSYLDWEVVGPVGKVVPAADGRVLGAHVHLEVLEKVVVLMRGERNQDADRPGQRGVHQRLGTARNQGCFLQKQTPSVLQLTTNFRLLELRNLDRAKTNNFLVLPGAR